MSYSCSGALLRRSSFRWPLLLIPPALFAFTFLLGIGSNSTLVGIAVLVILASFLPFVWFSQLRAQNGTIAADTEGVRFNGTLVLRRSHAA